MSYVFVSPRHGKCHLFCQTSGIQGFGAPKKFKISARGDGFGPVYVIVHRDQKDYGVTERPRANGELMRIAVQQFCDDGPLVVDVQKDLDANGAMFMGEILNRYGKPMRAAGIQAEGLKGGRLELGRAPGRYMPDENASTTSHGGAAAGGES